MSIKEVILKALKKPIEPSMMAEMLAKLRKGASGFFTTTKTIQVLNFLGWKITPVVGWVAMHGEPESPDSGPWHLVIASAFKFDSQTDFLDFWREMKKREVKSLRSSPDRAGEVAVMDVSKVINSPTGGYFHRREWRSAEGVKLQSPEGEEGIFLPHRYDLGKNRAIDQNFSEVWGWAAKNGALDDVNRALNTKTHVPASKRTAENTGTCPICFGNFKIMNDYGALAAHGYRRCGYGSTERGCRGGLSLEVSPDGTKAYMELLTRELAREKDSARLRHLRGDLDLHTKILAAWKKRPLPREGEIQRGVRFFLK